MYIKSINVRNIGPIKQCTIKPTFDKDGNPNPIVIIGENGTGKSYISSYICDSLIELSKNFYTDAVATPNSYFRYISGDNVSFGEEYSLVNIDFENMGMHIYFDERCGTIPDDKALLDNFVSLCDDNDQKRVKDALTSDDPFSKKILLPASIKNVNNRSNFISEIFTDNILCYFPADRTEVPHWLNEASIKTEDEILSDNQRPNDRHLYARLVNPINVNSSAKENAQWIEKIIYECSFVCDINEKGEVIHKGKLDLPFEYLKVKGKIEDCLKLVLKCENVEIVKSLPGSTSRYDIVCYKKGAEESNRITNISQLSLGESVLFNIFMTILRYAEQNNIMLFTGDVSNFKGIVVIDEIDTHLDTEMQYEILPQLLALFPKIQFIITTHSPLFLLGLEKYKKEHGKDYDLIEMPNGSHTSVEKFSEFEKAFNALTDTNKEEEKISKLLNEAINGSTNVPSKSILLVTEGKTDVKHIRRALEKFKAEGKYSDLNISFLDYKDNDTLGNGQMSKYETILSLLPKFDNGLKVVFLYDIDKGKYSKDLSYKKLGPSAYSFQLPLPDSRIGSKTPEELKKLSFSIEHLYTDEEIKKEYVGEDNVSRRLYMGNEFDSCGNSKNGLTASLRNKCGEGKLDIIDASNGGVKKTGEADKSDAINYALSKDDFYNLIVADENQHVEHTGFAGLFKKLQEIANDN